MKKAIVVIIFFNWMFSIFLLTIDTEYSPLWAVVLVVLYFGVSSRLLKYADKLIADINSKK